MLIVNFMPVLVGAWIVAGPPFIIWVSATMMDVGLGIFVLSPEVSLQSIWH